MRGLFLGIAALVAIVALAGCARNKPSFSRIQGSELQRLAFGPPKSVQQVFVEKVKKCWLEGPGAIVAGYRYDLAPAVSRTLNGTAQVERITLYSGRGEEVFAIEFHVFNENTLIATRNRGFPKDLATQLKFDVEHWVLEAPGCDAPGSGVIK